MRELWVFLFCTLVGPFMAAVVVLVYVAVLQSPAASGAVAIQAFVQGTFVAAIAGAGLAALTSARGTFGWLEAAVAGVLAVVVVALGSGAVAGGDRTAVAFLAALIAVACRALLIRIQILPKS